MAIRRWFAASLLLLGGLFSWPVRAESPEHALARPERGNRLWIRGIGYYGKAGDDHVLMIAPRFGGAFLLGDSVDLHIEMPLVVANVDVHSTQETETRVLPGNPFVGGSYVTSVDVHRFSFGLGVAIPLAHDKPGDAYDSLAFRYARGARAGREGWLYTPDHMAIVLSAAYETKIEHGPALGIDAAMGLMPRVRGRGTSFEATTQLGISAAGVITDTVRMGGRLDVVQVPSDTGIQRVQTALVPFLHVSTDDGVLFATELTVNLDKPYGFAFSNGRMWGLSIMAGSRF